MVYKDSVENPHHIAIQQPLFDQVAKRVLRRIWWRRWLTGLLRTFYWALIGLSIFFCWAMLDPMRFSPVWPVVGTGVWMLATAFYHWHRRPTPFSALALWDHAANRREAFAIAWWFESHARNDESAALHYQRQADQLQAAEARLHLDLPLPNSRKLVILPIVLSLIVAFAWWAPFQKDPPLLTPSMVQTAQREADRLDQRVLPESVIAALTPEQRETLQRQIAQAQKTLEASANKSARELLESLEARARETEKLAANLDRDDGEWASAELLSALREQADTESLGDNVADRNATRTATAADQIAERLEEANQSQPIIDRWKGVLHSLGQALQPADATRIVGEAIQQASRPPDSGEFSAAAQAMRTLARQMRNLAGTEQARDHLQQVAQQLRDAAYQVTRAEGNPSEPSSDLVSGDEKGNETSSLAISTEGTLTGKLMDGKESDGGSAEPTESGPSLGAVASSSNEDAPDSKAEDLPRLFAPVPGRPREDSQEPLLLESTASTPDADAFRVSGSGRKPSAATAELNAEATDLLKANRNVELKGRSTGEGSSSVRRVEGGAPGSEASTAANASTPLLEFLAAQEETLNESAIPPSRREQVRRYFNELRKRLEGSK